MSDKDIDDSALHKEVQELKKEVARLQGETERIGHIEKSLGYHELVLAKKVRDVNEINEKLAGCLNQGHLAQIKKGLKKVEQHEELILEGARYIKEVVRELDKVRQSHLSHAQSHSELVERHKKENDKKLDDLRSLLKQADESQHEIMAEAMKRVSALEKDLLDKLSQVEYQNRLIMKYLKRIDEGIFT